MADERAIAALLLSPPSVIALQGLRSSIPRYVYAYRKKIIVEPGAATGTILPYVFVASATQPPAGFYDGSTCS